jgi:hypothetical protein
VVKSTKYKKNLIFNLEFYFQNFEIPINLGQSHTWLKVEKIIISIYILAGDFLEGK